MKISRRRVSKWQVCEKHGETEKCHGPFSKGKAKSMYRRLKKHHDVKLVRVK